MSGRVGRGIVGIFAALGLLVAIVTVTPLTALASRWFSGPFGDPDGEVLIVLGGAYLEPGIIGEDTYWRSVYAVRAYRRAHFKRIILSGSGVSGNMRDFLASMGVPASVIELEERSSSTRENAINIQRMLGAVSGKPVLMTSDYHMRRAARTFSRAGLEVAPYPIPHALKLSGHWQTRWTAFLAEAGESLKIAYYAARGWI